MTVTSQNRCSGPFPGIPPRSGAPIGIMLALLCWLAPEARSASAPDAIEELVKKVKPPSRFANCEARLNVQEEPYRYHWRNAEKKILFCLKIPGTRLKSPIETPPETITTSFSSTAFVNIVLMDSSVSLAVP